MQGPRTVVQLVVDAAEVELASDALWQADPSAVLEVDVGEGRVRLTADVLDLARIPAPWAPTVLVVDDDGYLDAWRSWARPVRAGRRLVVHPAWLPQPEDPVEAEPADDVVLSIDPGRAFGSGSHESTRLALALLEDAVRPGARVLDVGCGSGVLAIAACCLGATEAIAIDIEPEAVAVTLANAAANGVGERVRASTDRLADVPGPFDLVLANIGGPVLGAVGPDLARCVADGGALVLSGQLEEALDAVVAACPGCIEVARVVEAGWAAARLERVSRR